MKKMYMLFFVLLSIVSGIACAGGPAPVVVVAADSSSTQTKGYAGLVWTLGSKKSAATPDLVVGVRTLKVETNGNVNSGADLSTRFTFLDGFSFDNLRLSYVAGKRELLGNLGVGYSFANSSFFTTLAAQGAYSRLGLDYEFSSNKVLPYLELISIDKP